jgi:hypothetical protein
MIAIDAATGRIRHLLKGINQDSFLTDRLIYSMLMKYASLYMRRQDSANKLMKFNSVIQTLDYVELEETDRIEASCKLVSGCKIMRTKKLLPAFNEGYYGPLIRSVSSVDGSQIILPTYPAVYERMSRQKTFKYNKNLYYWFLNDRLYFPNMTWDAVKIEGVFSEEIDCFTCETPVCRPMYQKRMNIPEFLFAEIEMAVLKDFQMTLQIPADMAHDNKNQLR